MNKSIIVAAAFSLFAPFVYAEGKPVAEHHAPVNEAVNALKSALEKSPETRVEKAPLKSETKKASKVEAEAAIPSWTDTPKETRAKIVTSWQALPEATRPPFPVYRDMMLEKQCKTDHDILSAKHTKHAPLHPVKKSPVVK